MTVGMNSWECLQTINDMRTSGASATFFATSLTEAANSALSSAFSSSSSPPPQPPPPLVSPTTSTTTNSSTTIAYSTSTTTTQQPEINLPQTSAPTCIIAKDQHNNNNNNNSSSSISSATITNNSNVNAASVALTHVSTTSASSSSASSNAHSLGSIKRMMKSAPRTGRNHAGAKYLASQYTKFKRLQEYIGLSLCLPLIAYNLVQFVIYFEGSKFHYIFLSVALSILTADFLSGIIHWAADSYGSVDMFLIGKNLLRNFREHHIDPTAITRHDFVETNGDNFTVIVPLMAYLAYRLTTNHLDVIQSDYNSYLFLFLLAVFISMTNQFHKWSHTYVGLPRLIAILQDMHLILPRIHHRVHHVTPHDTYFCITTGWLNYPLEKIQFWLTLETLVYRLSGVKPRTDDLMWALKTE